MGLPQIKIEFTSKANTAIQRSEQGVAMLLLDDTTSSVSATFTEYKIFDDVKATDWTAENLDLIEKTFLGSPNKVIIMRKVAEKAIEEQLALMKNKRFDYLAVPDATAEETPKIAKWIKSMRDGEGQKTMKAVLANHAADYEGVINFTTGKIKVGEKEYTTAQYTPRIAGILSGIPFTESSTYFVLDEVTEIEEKEDANGAIDAGELILVNDGEKIKIGRGVNSLTTLNAGKNKEWKKIKIIEIFDLIKDDIRDTFNDKYIGKVPNIYDNQLLFIVEVNNYLQALADEQILDSRATNKAWIDIEALRKAWKDDGSPYADLEDDKLKEMSYGSTVFLAGSIKAVDAVEDLQFKIAS